MPTAEKIAVDYEFMEQHDANALKKDDSDINQHSVNLGYGTLFKYPSLRTVTIGGSFIYFAIQFVYYGAIFAIGSVAGSLYLNTFLLGFSEFLGYVASVPMVRFMKRKVSFSSTFILAGISSLAFFACVDTVELLRCGWVLFREGCADYFGYDHKIHDINHLPNHLLILEWALPNLSQRHRHRFLYLHRKTRQYFRPNCCFCYGKQWCESMDFFRSCEHACWCSLYCYERNAGNAIRERD